FSQPRAHSLPETPSAAGEEAWALFDLGLALRKNRAANWRLRIPILLASLDRAEVALEEEPAAARTWLLLGNCHRHSRPELRCPPRTPLQGWDPETGLAWAQATYCFRRGLECDPNDVAILQALLRSYASREMFDAQEEVAERLRALQKPIPVTLPP